jgi:hypothetical protein
MRVPVKRLVVIWCVAAALTAAATAFASHTLLGRTIISLSTWSFSREAHALREIGCDMSQSGPNAQDAMLRMLDRVDDYEAARRCRKRDLFCGRQIVCLQDVKAVTCEDVAIVHRVTVRDRDDEVSCAELRSRRDEVLLDLKATRDPSLRPSIHHVFDDVKRQPTARR